MHLTLLLLACVTGSSDKPAAADTASPDDSAATADSGAPDDTGDTTDTGEHVASITISGTLGCDSCVGSTYLLVTGEAPGSEEAVRAAALGDFSVSVPATLGETLLVAAWSDDDGDGLLDVTEPVGVRIDAAAVVEGAASGVEIEIVASAWDDTLPRWGVELETGEWVLTNGLMVVIDDKLSDAEAATLVEDAGGTLEEWDPEMGLLWMALDDESLSDEDALAQLEAAASALGADSRVVEVLRDAPLPDASRTRTQADDDYVTNNQTNLSHFTARVDQAKDIYDDCAYHLTASQRARTVSIGIVDADLQGLSGATEVTSSWASSRELARPEWRWTSTTGNHGTAVSSILMGRNNGQFTNGFATGFQGNQGGAYSIRPTLYPWNIGHGATSTVSTTLRGLWAAAREAQVVNASVGFGVRDLGVKAFWKNLRILRRGYRHFSDTIFVVAAPNNPPGQPAGSATDIDRFADFSSFSGNSNVISVGGMSGEAGWGGFSNDGRIEIAAEVQTDYWGRQVTWDGNTVTSTGASGYFRGSGTSFATPQIASAVAVALAMDDSRTGGDILTALLITGDKAATDNRSGRRLNLQRFIVGLIGAELGSETEYLMKVSFGTPAPASTCRAFPIEYRCLPVDSGLDEVGKPDIGGNTYDITEQTFSSADGADFDITLEGRGLNLGYFPHTTRLQGTVARPDSYAVEDLQVTGTYAGGPDNGSCTYEGDFTAILYRVQNP